MHPGGGSPDRVSVDFWFLQCCWLLHLLCVNVRLHTHTFTHTFNGPFPGLPRWAGTRKVKPIWILLKQETVSGSGISWAICKSASRSRQIPCQYPTTQVFYRPDALPAAQPTASKHWRQYDAMNGGAKCRKWGSLGQLGGNQGHWQCHQSIKRIRLPIRL